MNSWSKLGAVAAAIIVLAVFGLFFYVKRPLGPGSDGLPAGVAAPGAARVLPGETPQESMKRMMSAEILFYGLVVDQHGDPVPDAEVTYYVHGMKSPGRDGMIVRTDAKGLFKVSGVQGGQLSVTAAKEGYTMISDYEGNGVTSQLICIYGMADDGGRRYMNPAMPSKLTLAKLGAIEPLVRCKLGHQPLAPNGGVLRVCVDEAGTGHAVDFRLDVDPAARPQGGAKERYTWSCLITVPEGEIAPVNGPGFTAPSGGYASEARVGHDETEPDGVWRPVAPRAHYFVRFKDGTHALIEAEITSKARKDGLFLHTFYNTKPGSTQLAPGDEHESRSKRTAVIPRDAVK
ncbi:carboxypeptidase-like regulatory domain-containing protein [Haloferula sp. BvORR071]|uniref:carboxypeptidase-like regulatory domain-containing protein n=1 Tax=Haloferula sp. BvORR071 TaxID=1396141 RepID=UPI00224104AC|nr:carboxypeptidase-like regulatory domain-containing protein [Haloferula sp. BvORR071]